MLQQHRAHTLSDMSLDQIIDARTVHTESVLHWSTILLLVQKVYSASGEMSPSVLRSNALTALIADNVSSPPYSERESIVSYNNHIST